MGSDMVALILTVVAITFAVGLFLLAGRLVSHARAGTREFRIAHQDPHAPETRREDVENDGRDIKQ